MTITEYRVIRSSAKDFVYKILDWKKDSKQDLMYAGKQLGFWDGEAMVFDSEEESDVLMDFLIYERGKKGTKLIDAFYDSDTEVEELEEEILEGMISYHASLFEIVSVDKEKNEIQLIDLLDTHHKSYVLMDLGLSQTSGPGLIFYTRLIPIRDVHMTSGVSFGFDISFKQKLLNELSFVRFKRKGKLNSTDLFLFAFKKSKSYGINIGAIDTDEF